MKKQFKSVLVALAVTAGALTSQAADYNGDLIIGFTTQTGNDFEYDLGPVLPANGQTWNLSSLLGSLNVATVKWGVIGSDGNTGLAYTTRAAGVPPTLSEGSWASQDLAVQSVYGLFGTAGAGANTSPSSTSANSWNQQTIAGSLTTTYKNSFQNPNTTGYGSTTLYSVFLDGSAPTALGTFSFANDGIVTFNAVAVPEPSTYGLIAGAGLLLVSFRRKFVVQA